jgi:hypothetical protein
MTERGARMVVEAVDVSSSRARVLDGTVRAGERARLTGYRYPVLPLRVNIAGIDTEGASALRLALNGVEGVEVIEQELAFGHLLVRRRANELRVVGADGFVRHEGIAVGAAGAADLATRLRLEAAAKWLADMENPAQPFGVTLRLEDGKTSFGIGETVSFHATSERDGYLTLVDLGTDGKVVMLFPNAHQPATRIQAGETLSFPTPESGFELQIFPPAGRGTVRVFVTPTPLDVPMEGEYPEGDERFARTIGEAVTRAAGSADGAVRLDTWATASLVYDIRK